MIPSQLYGLSVRWSLANTDETVVQALREYVAEVSMAKFAVLPGLSHKTWRMRPGEWFEGSYVWVDASQRDAFAAGFEATGANNPASHLIGCAPSFVEFFEVVAVVEGPAQFSAGVGPGHP